MVHFCFVNRFLVLESILFNFLPHIQHGLQTYGVELNRHPADCVNSEVTVKSNPPEETRQKKSFSFLSLCSQVVRELRAERRSERRRNSASYHSEADERIQQVPQAFL